MSIPKLVAILISFPKRVSILPSQVFAFELFRTFPPYYSILSPLRGDLLSVDGDVTGVHDDGLIDVLMEALLRGVYGILRNQMS